MGQQVKELIADIMKQEMQTREQKAIQEVIKICLPEVDSKAVIEAIGKVAKAVVEAIPVMIRTVNNAWEQVKEQIKTMPEEQYKEFLKELTPEARGWAAAIRAAADQEKEGGI